MKNYSSAVCAMIVLSILVALCYVITFTDEKVIKIWGVSLAFTNTKLFLTTLVSSLVSAVLALKMYKHTKFVSTVWLFIEGGAGCTLCVFYFIKHLLFLPEIPAWVVAIPLGFCATVLVHVSAGVTESYGFRKKRSLE